MSDDLATVTSPAGSPRPVTAEDLTGEALLLSEAPEVRLGLIVAPGDPAIRLSRWMVPLDARLRRTFPGQSWDLELVIDGLSEPTTGTATLVDRARQMLVDRAWDFAIVVTDIPVQIGRRPASSVISETHGVGVLSWPAVGPLFSESRVTKAVVELVGGVVGAVAGGASNHARTGQLRAIGRRTRILPVRLQLTRHRNGFGRSGRVGYLHMFLGMVVSNRPWRVALVLTKSLAAALATIAFAVVTSDVWAIALDCTLLRLVLLTVVSVGLAATGLVVRHQLWERSDNPSARRQVALFNVVTVATCLIGIVVLYTALLAVSLAAGALLVPGRSLHSAVGTPPDLTVRAQLAWFVASLATLGGAVGAGLESEEAIQQAAYSARPFQHDEPPDPPSAGRHVTS